MSLSISVIVSTYNSPAWLEKVLWGFENQSYKDFQIVIADDGSTDETRILIDDFKNHSSLDIEHVWHEDNGFQKCMILNKAIIAAKGNYLIFTDGDCVPRRDFVQAHREQAKPGYFLSGGYFKLPMSCSKAIGKGDIISGDAFDINWLQQHGYPTSAKKARLTAKGNWAKILNFIITTKKTWNGNNSSGWKSDILKINGFDERMQSGGQDVEMGNRMKYSGVKAKRVRYTAVCVHLDHARGYKNDASIANNRIIRAETIRERKQYTPYGIVKS
jgi:glycosyltransferase involved in cell wall biosynthesis